ncbi:MAG: energy-coupling factor transporter transmembrane protein EcfT [Ruminococcus sp.]|nr:energy-coupling factor transporter transmembrane protein EcfT [Ruminococcus sp.]
MLKDITIGQYFPGDSLLHRLDARFKIVMTLLYIVMLFMGEAFYSLAFGMVYCIAALLLSRLPVKLFFKSLKPLIPILLFTAVLDVFFITDGTVYLEAGFLKITEEGVLTAVRMVVRIIFLIVGSSLLTYTTSPIQLTDAIERLLAPLKKVHFPVHSFAMMMTIALRFIPTLMEETDKIIAAQKARGASFDTGKLTDKAKALVPVLIPLFVSAFRRAEELATAMECRCYRGDIGRTKMKQMHACMRDWIALGVTLLLLCCAAAAAVLL